MVTTKIKVEHLRAQIDKALIGLEETNMDSARELGDILDSWDLDDDQVLPLGELIVDLMLTALYSPADTVKELRVIVKLLKLERDADRAYINHLECVQENVKCDLTRTVNRIEKTQQGDFQYEK